MTEGEFHDIFIECSMEVADQFYPKINPSGPNPGRGAYLRDQGVLFAKLVDRLRTEGFIRPSFLRRFALWFGVDR